MKTVVCQGSHQQIDDTHAKWARCDHCTHIIAVVDGVMRKHWWSNTTRHYNNTGRINHG